MGSISMSPTQEMNSKDDNVANNFSDKYNSAKSDGIEMKQLPVVITAFGPTGKNPQTVENDNDMVNKVNSIFDSTDKGNDEDIVNTVNTIFDSPTKANDKDIINTVNTIFDSTNKGNDEDIVSHNITKGNENDTTK
eukprot:466260_1